MKYSLDEAVAKIGERKKELIRRKNRRDIGILSSLTVLTVFALAIVMYRYIGFTAIDAGSSAYGSFMLPDEAGGYILVGVLCFVAAVIITLLCIRYASGKTGKKGHFPKSPAREEISERPDE
ncbi:MAG: hypothetical protein K6E62_13820 [Lachnospiraceae bacterium]|nr:hypothetical protein [Lachnospiraceae bacterium]